MRPSRERRYPWAPPNPGQARVRGPFHGARRGTVALGQETTRRNRPSTNCPRDSTPNDIGGRGNDTGGRRVGPGNRAPFFPPSPRFCLIIFVLGCFPMYRTLRLSPTASPKFRPLKKYSLSFTEHSKRFCPLYILRLQQRPLNSIP
jgi:hypothetical protein